MERESVERTHLLEIRGQPPLAALGLERVESSWAGGVVRLAGAGAVPRLWLSEVKSDLLGALPANRAADHLWHSAELRANSTQQWGYWRTLLHSPTVGFNIGN